VAVEIVLTVEADLTTDTARRPLPWISVPTTLPANPHLEKAIDITKMRPITGGMKLAVRTALVPHLVATGPQDLPAISVQESFCPRLQKKPGSQLKGLISVSQILGARRHRSQTLDLQCSVPVLP